MTDFQQFFPENKSMNLLPGMMIWDIVALRKDFEKFLRIAVRLPKLTSIANIIKGVYL